MTLARMSTRGRLTIPKEIRDSLGISPGDTVAFIEKDDVIFMQHVRDDDIGNLFGSVIVDGRQDFQKIREEVKRKREEKRGG